MKFKASLIGLAALSFFALHAGAADSIFQPNDLLAICGDSITDQKVYSVYIEDYLLMCQPVSVRSMQCGWAGASASSSAGHMKSDVMTLHANVATTYYGMNDGGYNVADPAVESNYKASLTKLITDFKATGTRTIIIGSPGIVDSHFFKNPKHKEVTAEQYNNTLGRLADVAKDVAAANGLAFADLHTNLMTAMAKAKATYGDTYPFEGEADGVHAGPPGHLVMAYTLLKAMNLDGDIGTISFDAATGKADATDGHRIVSAGNGEIVVESKRYPFCFFNGLKDGDKNDAIASTEGFSFGNATTLQFIPFNQDLNRFMLVVKNLKSPKATITWGEQSKVFTAAQLASGINLADAFLRNPFVTTFFDIHRKVQAQQSFENLFIRSFLSDQKKQLLQQLPAQAEAIQQLEDNFKAIEAGFQDSCAKAVVPVTHTIKIVETN